MEEIKEDTHNFKGKPYSWIERLHTLLTRGFLQKLRPVAGDLLSKPDLSGLTSFLTSPVKNFWVTKDNTSLVNNELFLSFSHSVMFNSVTPWITAYQVSLSFTVSQSLLKLMFIELVMPSNHLVLCHPLLLLPSIFPSHQGLFHWVSDAIKPSHPLLSTSLPALNLSQYQGLFQWFCSSH